MIPYFSRNCRIPGLCCMLPHKSAQPWRLPLLLFPLTFCTPLTEWCAFRFQVFPSIRLFFLHRENGMPAPPDCVPLSFCCIRFQSARRNILSVWERCQSVQFRIPAQACSPLPSSAGKVRYVLLKRTRLRCLRSQAIRFLLFLRPCRQPELPSVHL